MTEDIVGFRPGEECSICQGRCCKERGCSLSPEDLTAEERQTLLDVESTVQFLKRDDNLYAVDVTYGAEGRLYYLRMRTKCYTFVGVEGFGECCALTENGCSLDYSRRPKGGRCLKSSPDFHCRQEYMPEEMEKDWQQYQSVLSTVYDKYSVILEEDGTIEECEKAYRQFYFDKKKKQD